MPLNGRSDDELVDEYRRSTGERRATIVEELFARQYERVARWCLRFTGNRESAADLAQEVFLKAHRHLDTFKGTARFSTWLYSIVRHEAFNRLQRAPPDAEGDELLSDIATAIEGPEDLLMRTTQRERLHEFLSNTLEPTERKVFTLHYGDDMPLDSITRLLRLDNASGAKAYIVSARRKISRATTRLRARGEQL